MMHPLISNHELHQLIDHAPIVIIDCRYDLMDPDKGYKDYQTAHIPKAQYADIGRDLSSTITATSGRHPLPTATQFQLLLQRLGIDEETQVVVYDAANSLFAARFWWLLKCFGHKSVQVLNGGLQDYQAHFPLTSDTSEPRPSNYPLKEFTALASYDVAMLEKVLDKALITLVDVRTNDRYHGENETIDPISGHIKGALNLPFDTHLDASMKFVTKVQLQENFKPFMNLDKPIVFSCGSGITACHSFLALTIADLSAEAAIYPGSWSEWIKDPKRPIES